MSAFRDRAIHEQWISSRSESVTAARARHLEYSAAEAKKALDLLVAGTVIARNAFDAASVDLATSKDRPTAMDRYHAAEMDLRGAMHRLEVYLRSRPSVS